MEYRFYRELKHNYLVFEDEREVTSNSDYGYRIAESGRIKGLVPCAKRSVNGRKYLYYEIGSMQSLRDRYSARGMDITQLLGLLKAAKDLLEEMSEFLLGDEALVFNSGSIYTDLSTGEYRFIYCPFFDESKTFSEFAMELTGLVDESDERALSLVYRLCELSSDNGGFVYEAIEEAIGSAEGDDVDEDAEAPAEENAQQGVVLPDTDELFSDSSLEKEDEEEGRKKRAKQRLGGKLQLLLSLLFAAVVGAMVYIRMNYRLSSEENMLSIGVMLISAVTGAFALISGIKEMKSAWRGKDEGRSEDKDKAKVSEDDFWGDDFSDEGDSSFHNGDFAEAKSTYYRDVINGYGERFGSGEGASKRNTGVIRKRNIPLKSPEPSADLETVVLDDGGNAEPALFSRNLDKTIRIALDKFPITIGKMDGCVDTVIKDESVSRIHCRIEKEGERFSILDLGSTNGTYRNGLRIPAQQRTFIEEGDEIRIGRVCFDCR